jgi:flagellar basal body rod protein FlgB
MLTDLSVLKLTGAMARHSGHANAVTADNLARADIPGAKARATEEFRDALAGRRAGAPQIDELNRPISTETEMLSMARHAGRHDAALGAWKSTLGLMRLALSRPE